MCEDTLSGSEYEVDIHQVVRQQLVPEQLAHEEGNDAQFHNGRAIVGDE